ncbi:hypothetical protein ABZP36_000015 [Zizania latifolia]
MQGKSASWNVLNQIGVELDSQNSYTALVYGTSALVAIWISSIVITALDSVPLALVPRAGSGKKGQQKLLTNHFKVSLKSTDDFFHHYYWAKALIEPDYGCDASSLRTAVTKVPGGWHLDGQKHWIGNTTFADVLIILARNSDTNQLNGFIVKKGAPGLKCMKIENKIGFRMVQNGDILLNKVFVPEEDRLTGINSFQDINKSFGIHFLAHPNLIFYLLKLLISEPGKMTVGHASLGKAWTSRKAREVVSLGRELLGGNRILADFLVAKAFCDLEPIFSYEGTYDINSLVTGREITRIVSFKPSTLAKARL